MIENISTGFYHPDSNTYFTDFNEYLKWYENKKFNSSDDTEKYPKVGIFFSRHLILRKNLLGINSLIYELEKNDIIPVPVFSQQKEHSTIKCNGYSIDIGQLKNTDAIINCVSSFILNEKIIDNNENTILNIIDVPIFHAVCSTGQTEEEWRNNKQGITAMNQIYWIAQPEFNGIIEPIVIFAASANSDNENKEYIPIKDRIEFLIKRIKNWIKLSKIPKKERKVTILLHNNPCAGAEASVGGGNGLDTFESVVELLKMMDKEGYYIENIPANGKSLLEEIMRKKAINEFRWTTIEEIVKKGGALFFVDKDKYQDYFNKLSEVNKKKMIENWGEFPGESMVYEDKIVITGLKFGNIKVMVEPKRGCYGSRCDGEVCKILHNPEIPPTHQCYAAFKWIQENSDLIISIGTHGYIEFLPGKSVGLSSDCFSEIITGEIPHIYVYTSKNPNEAIIAKRRAYAVIVDHIIPFMESTELYNELSELEELIAQYNNAKQLNENNRKKILFDEIIKISNKIKLFHRCEKHSQINIDEEKFISEIHNKIFLIRDSSINMGLHILSKTNDKTKTAKMIFTILKYDGNLPSIRRIILEIMGYNYDEIIKGPEKIFKNKSGLEIINESEKIALRLIENVLINNRIDEDFISAQFQEIKFKKESIEKLISILVWIKDIIFKNLMKTEREIPQIIKSIDKKYISPGAGGLLTRNKIDVLPTGRNIFSIDPRKIPTKTAYKIGVELAEELIMKYKREENKYPEKIGMVLWSTDVYRGDGEEISQILHLIGARPVWNESGVVNDIEIIPLSELKRPRIDVIIRTSEIFRDTLPNLIELIDKAIIRIANLEEKEEENYIRKNVKAIKEKLKKRNSELSEEALFRMASFRLFAAKPGTYGNGIKLIIAASAWKTIVDLGEVFLEHGGYAYGENVFGQEAYPEFAHNLEKVKIVFHKMESDETDPLGCCYNDFQGGMTAAVRSLSKEMPKVFWGNTKNNLNSQITELSEEIERIVRVKLLNPQWLENMKKHGYKGAQDIAHKAATLYSWDATANVVEDWIFDEVTKKYILDEEMRKFFEANNPWALEELSRRFLEAAERGLWNADPEILAELKNQYIQIEGIMEEQIDYLKGANFQGGNVNIITKDEVANWRLRSKVNIKDYM